MDHQSGAGDNAGAKTVHTPSPSPSHRDPITGDVLTTGEWISWRIQGIIRRWTFLCIVLAVTAACWLTNNPGVLTWWNLSASLLAIIIETIVGLAMFGQTRRDAVIIRKVERQEQMILQIVEHHGITVLHNETDGQ